MAVMLRASMRDLLRGARVPPLRALRWPVLRDPSHLDSVGACASALVFAHHCWPCPKPPEGHAARRVLSFLAMSKTGSRPLSLEGPGGMLV